MADAGWLPSGVLQRQYSSGVSLFGDKVLRIWQNWRDESSATNMGEDCSATFWKNLAKIAGKFLLRKQDSRAKIMAGRTLCGVVMDSFTSYLMPPCSL
jgi:hypothetical protein